ncbi:MAG: hypothetical protein KME60_31100 [Cyanomargarita calcarea GSE-NOS-MK-12-04C]|uniref:Uncharacterized protein n=1 Tax=Cyanomargarita calcarea GSE-NOS-MK-12-04C TaxID=2839659 RepID=A0A951QW76_9CYAN|nr:hypothetical protein [Cyanomargarita calcarea GSE-NOS-MK-12-04C]
MIKRKRKFRIKPLFVVAFALLFLCTTAHAQTPVKMSNYSPTADYVRALSSANIFLSSWRDRNNEGRRKKEEGRRSFLDGDTEPQLKTDDHKNGRGLKPPARIK